MLIYPFSPFLSKTTVFESDSGDADFLIYAHLNRRDAPSNSVLEHSTRRHRSQIAEQYAMGAIYAQSGRIGGKHYFGLAATSAGQDVFDRASTL
jgi:hypothetical protein